MRANRWLPIVALIVLSACTPAEDGEDAATSFVQVGDVQQLMAAVVEPAADVYWDAVGVIIDEEGTHELAPTTDEEWAAVRNAAFMLAESGNLLMIGDRPADRGAWIAMSQSMVEVGRRALEAAEARDLTAIFDMGAEVYYVCTNCHATYALETLSPNDTRAN